jgi:hypothetical protein
VTRTKNRPPRTKPYTAPDGAKYDVDAALDPAVLDRLNNLPGVMLWSICAGHPRSASRAIGPREHPDVMFLVPTTAVGHVVGGLATCGLPWSLRPGRRSIPPTRTG